MSYQRYKPPKGRKKGAKNLRYLPEGIVNQHGVIFSEQEKRALESAVNSANRKRKRMLEAESRLPRKVGGVETGDTVASLQLMGKESDFILARKTKSLQRFKTHEDYDRYMENLRRVNSPTYIDERTRQYKRNYRAALRNAFGDEARDIEMRVQMMKPEEFRRVVGSDENLEIGFIYDPAQGEAKMNAIRASLGMKIKDQ